MTDKKEEEMHKVKFIMIDVGRVESTITVHDHPNCVVYTKTFYHYDDSSYTAHSVVEFAIAIASKYGIDEMWINEDGMGIAAYDHLTKCHTRFGFALYKYKSRRLSLNE